MAKLVTKFKYQKPSDRANFGNYAKYIATRDGVDTIDDSLRFATATVKQKYLIERILQDFPDSREMLEYEDYSKSLTIGTASEFISRAIEDNICEISDNKTYADYIATRPRVERFGSHGLFTDDGIQVQLSKVSEELNHHGGNIWTVIISLRREDAERLGFNHGARWRDMLRTQTETIASNFKIPMENLKWFSAFHNESYHPHAHLIVYSSIENEGYLTAQGVNNIRSSLAKDIFTQDLESVYAKQTAYRNNIRTNSREMVAEIISQINSDSYDNPQIEKLILQLANRLKRTSGKKVYGYLKADVKNIVDAIVDELSQDKRIAKLYDLWYEQKEEIMKTYTEAELKRISLSKNKEFKSIRNEVIREALNITPDNLMVDNVTGTSEIAHDPYQEPYDSDIVPATPLPGQQPAVNMVQLNKSSTLIQKKNGGAAIGALRLLRYMSQMIQNRIDGEKNSESIDRKLKNQIDEKKQAHGIKQE